MLSAFHFDGGVHICPTPRTIRYEQGGQAITIELPLRVRRKTTIINIKLNTSAMSLTASANFLRRPAIRCHQLANDSRQRSHLARMATCIRLGSVASTSHDVPHLSLKQAGHSVGMVRPSYPCILWQVQSTLLERVFRLSFICLELAFCRNKC